MKSVFLMINEWKCEGITVLDYRVFSTKEKAMEALREFVAKEKEGSWIVDSLDDPNLIITADEIVEKSGWFEATLKTDNGYLTIAGVEEKTVE
jgi:hypothetical protein